QGTGLVIPEQARVNATRALMQEIAEVSGGWLGEAGRQQHERRIVARTSWRPSLETGSRTHLRSNIGEDPSGPSGAATYRRASSGTAKGQRTSPRPWTSAA